LARFVPGDHHPDLLRALLKQEKALGTINLDPKSRELAYLTAFEKNQCDGPTE
jgi:alkylhydroperoxidase family enzyme